MRRFSVVLAALLTVVALSISGNVAGAVAAPGSVANLGSAPALPGPTSPGPLVAISATPTGLGYWVAGADGSVVTAGDAGFFGSLAAKPASPVIDLVSTPSGKGYWLVGADGAVFSFGDAAFLGAWSGPHEPVVGAARTSGGDGYWIVGSQGTVKAFGKAAAVDAVKAPVVHAIGNPGGAGLWLLGSDGGVFALGGAPFLGSMHPNLLNSAFVTGAATAGGDGLLLATTTGNVVALGAAKSPGDAAVAAGKQVAGLALAGQTLGAWVLTSSTRVFSHPLLDLPAGSGQGRRVVYANRAEQVWIVGDDGQVVRTYLVSGRPGIPSPGLYHVQSKSVLAYARANGITMRHMVRFIGGIGFHEIPRYANDTPMQTEAQLGTYQS
ncbi:MAG: Esterase, partial [Acidimicrobiia bacterium]|nr:Esterase [Acidimicrobiia bacterium]